MAAKRIARTASICRGLPTSLSGRRSSVTASLPIIFNRTARTSTRVKVSDLPQGALPPLPLQNDKENVIEKEYPAVLQQHKNNLLKYKDCVLLTRVGDFYEMYFEQVEQYAPQVGLKVAKRNTTLGDVPMAGFQHSQLERYVKMFMDLDKHVAIAEQIRIPDHERTKRNGAAKFDRKVTRIITPGTLIDESFVDPRETNFLLAIDLDRALALDDQGASNSDKLPRDSVGLAWVDLSSGDFNVQHSTLQALPALVARISPREVVLKRPLEEIPTKKLSAVLGDGQYSISFHDMSGDVTDFSHCSFVIKQSPVMVQEYHIHELSAANIILDYVKQQLVDANVQLQPPARRNESEFMSIDKQSLRALEIKATLRDNHKQGSLLNTVRRTVTNSGARLLSQRIVSPQMSISVINQRLDLVEQMLDHPALHEQVISLLKATWDTSRLLQKFAMGRGDADDLIGMSKTINMTQKLSDALQKHTMRNDDTLSESEKSMDFILALLHRIDLESPGKLAKEIESSIDQEGLSRKHTVDLEQAEKAERLAEEVVDAEESGQAVPKLARRLRPSSSSNVTERKDIWIMNRDHGDMKVPHRNYDELLSKTAKLESDLRERFACDSLTLRHSPNHGHHCHIKGKDVKSAITKHDGIRAISSSKTTKTFAIADWTALGHQLDAARTQIREAEDKVLTKLRAHVLENLMKLRRNAAVLDELDVACSSAVLAKENNFIRPVLTEAAVHRIIGGRHPTVDVAVREQQGTPSTTTDCHVGGEAFIHFITGPNMGGKSTYLRQNALITILAQTGSFVPADYAEIGLVDHIFSRVGSADSLYNDQSTFMVEMLETAAILKQATPRSFVIMDEVGRGTTPLDGKAVGYACLHHLSTVNRCRTLFATHFHDLADMTEPLGGIAFYCTDIAEEETGSYTYIHKLRPGVNRNSHALKVAREAGLPEAAIASASKVLADSGVEQASRAFAYAS